MKIEMQPKYNVYRKTVSSDTAAQHQAASASEGKLDVVDITHGATVADKAFAGMKSGINSYLAAPSSEERLEALRAGIKNGAYRIDTADLVDSIMKG